MKRLLREPFSHFLVLGAALFVLYGVLNRSGTAQSPESIVVTSGQVQHLAIAFAKTWQRPASDSDLKGLIDDYVREEIAIREAKALGLDKDDTMIRRRLRQKIEFIQDDAATQVPATDAELTTYLQGHRAALGLEERFSFRQAYLDPHKRGARLAADAKQLADKLNASATRVDVESEGDPFVLGHTFTRVAGAEVASQFGKDFLVRMSTQAPGKWQPVESGFGMHVVSSEERTDADLPIMDDVRAAVRVEFDNERRRAARDKHYAELLKHYTVTVEPWRVAAPTNPGTTP